MFLINGFAALFAATMGRDINVLFLKLVGRHALSRAGKTLVEQQIQSFIEDGILRAYFDREGISR